MKIKLKEILIGIIIILGVYIVPTQAKADEVPNNIKISVTNKKITVGNSFQLHIDGDQLKKSKVLLVDLSKAPKIKVANTHAEGDLGITVTPEKSRFGKQVLKISSTHPITEGFDISLKSTESGNNQIKLIDENNNQVSNEINVSASYNRTAKVSAVGPNDFAAEEKNVIKLNKTWEPADTNTTAYLKLNQTTGLYFNFPKALQFGETEAGYAPDVFFGLNRDPKTGKYKKQQIIFSKDGAPNESLYGLLFKKEEDSNDTFADDSYSSLLYGSLLHTPYGEAPLEELGKIYQATDSNARTTLKVVGVYSRKQEDIEYEILYHFSDDSPTVQEELFVKNIGKSPIDSATYYTINPSFENGRDYNLKDMGNQNGAYLSNDNFKMFVKFKVSDGPIKYSAGERYSRAILYTFGHTVDGHGMESLDLAAGKDLGVGNQPALVTLWKWETLKPGEVQHRRIDMGAVVANNVVPDAKEEYTNLTSKDGTNHVGDRLKFVLKAHNLGYKSKWGKLLIDNKLPVGLDIDPTTIKLTDPDGNESKVSSTAYDAKNRLLSVKSPDLTDNQWSSVTFEAKLNSWASGQLVVNPERVHGVDLVDGSNENDSAMAYAYIAVEKADYLAKLEKTVKNISGGDQDYKTNTEGHAGDEVAYKLTYTVDENSPKRMKSGNLTDTVPTGITVDKNSIKVKQVDKQQQIPCSELNNIPLGGQTQDHQKGVATVEFNAKINDDVKTNDILKNTGTVVAIPNRTDGTGETITSESEADINITPLPYQTTFLQHVKNLTTSNKQESDWHRTVEGHTGDKIAYQTIYKVDKDSCKELLGGKIKDQLAANLALDKGSIRIKINGNEVPLTDKNKDLNSGISIDKHLGHGDTVELYFEAKIKDTAKEKDIIENKAHLDGKVDGIDRGEDSKVTHIRVKKQTVGTVTFKYVDRRTNQEIGDKEVVAKGAIGKKISGLSPDEIGGKDPNKIRPAFIQGYVAVDYSETDDSSKIDFNQGIKDFNPVISEKPQVYTIRYERSVIGIAVPKMFDFGRYLPQTRDATYHLKAKTAQGNKEPYRVMIEDYYGVQNWELSVKQDKQFSGIKKLRTRFGKTDVLTYTLDNATLHFKNAQLKEVLSDKQGNDDKYVKKDIHSDFTLDPEKDQAPTVVVAYKKSTENYAADPKASGRDNKGNKTYLNPGFSVYQYQFGDRTNADYSIGLHVPATTKREKIAYTTTLTWQLSVAP